jgi:AraC family transcriptional regulator
MLNATPLTAAVTWLPGAASSSPDATVLAKLLADASANLDYNRDVVKVCIRRAVDLLRSRSIGERLPAGSPLGTSPLPRLQSPVVIRRGGLASWQVKKVAAYIEEHIGSNILVPELARTAGLSTGHFFRSFRESFGETPHAYIAGKRIQRGKQLMLSTRASLCQIALECGLSDQSHFTRVFRRKVGMNPGLWRRQFAADPN